VAHAERPELAAEAEPIHPDIVIDMPLPAITTGASRPFDSHGVRIRRCAGVDAKRSSDADRAVV
jgi:hypothetical protein